MLSMVVIGIGIVEFVFGVILTLFSKSKKIFDNFSTIYFNFEEVSSNIIKSANSWIGGTCGLTGSLYIFSATLIYVFDLNITWLLLMLILIEIYSYKRINKGLEKIVKESQ